VRGRSTQVHVKSLVSGVWGGERREDPGDVMGCGGRGVEMLKQKSDCG